MGKLVPAHVRDLFTKDIVMAFKTLFAPMTSTQLGIIDRALNIHKQRGLEISSKRARQFRLGFLSAFKGKNAQEIGEFHSMITYREEMDLRGQIDRDIDTLVSRKYENRAIRNMKLKLFLKFQDYLIQDRRLLPGRPLRPNSEHFIRRWLLKKPTTFARVSATFNVLATLGAISSIILELANPYGELYSHHQNESIPAICSVVATVIGAIGSAKGVFDLAKDLKDRLFPRASNVAEVEEIPMQDLNRVPDEVPIFDRYINEEFRVDFASTNRLTARFSTYFSKTAQLSTKVFLALGVVADLSFLALGAYKLYKDFHDGKASVWQKANDIGLTVTAGFGAIIGRYGNLYSCSSGYNILIDAMNGVNQIYTIGHGMANK